MLCGGKVYRPDDSFKELPDYTHEEQNELVDTAGVAVLWEILPAKYTRQVHYLSDGTSWLNYSTLENTMNDTGFTDSLKFCSSTLANSCTNPTAKNDTFTDSCTDSNFSHQQDSTIAHQNEHNS